MLALLFITWCVYEAGLIYHVVELEDTIPAECSKSEAVLFIAGVLLWPAFRIAGLFQPVTQRLLPDIGETA